MEQLGIETGGQAETRTYTTEQFKGLLADKQSEVKKRQDAEKRATELERELAAFKTPQAEYDREMKARAAIDPHAPAPETKPQNDEDRPLTMRDLVEILGEMGGKTETPAPKTGGRTAGGVPGTSPMWFLKRRNVPISQLSDKELDELAQEIV
jgi:hypothetical protein